MLGVSAIMHHWTYGVSEIIRVKRFINVSVALEITPTTFNIQTCIFCFES